jgi:hypothetical protein
MNYPSRPSPFPPTWYEDEGKDDDADSPRRMFLFEPGWHIGVKTGSQREFCHTRAPGQDFYHRLLDGEIFLQREDERLCVPCARRRGLISAEPKRLRETVIPLPADADIIPLELGWCDADRF